MANKDFMARNSAFNPYRLWRKELGFGTPVGSGDALAKSLYCGMKPISSWDSEQSNSLPTGGVYNLEFSPEGSLLVAACEKKCIQIFDPLTHQRVHSVHGAHSDCVNCVKFLDGRMFATCSDDTTVALWDVRNLKKKIRSLLGHSNWVKNIEFSFKDKLLVTSGLEGSIYTWDINSYTEYNLVYQRVFHASGLMRCKLSPDARQMVMCTTGGLLVIVHDLNLSTLAQHLHGFKPNLYRLMQMSQQLIPIAATYDHLFDSNRKENRIEFVSDFPEGNDAKVVGSLQIHPQGWSALSRNISHDDRSEWSCIHDIQPYSELEGSDKSTRDGVGARAPRRVLPRRPARRLRPRLYRQLLLQPSATATTPAQSQSPENQNEREDDRDESEPEPGPSASRSEDPAAAAPDGSRLSPGLSSIQNDVWEASITIKQHRTLQEMYSRQQSSASSEPPSRERPPPGDDPDTPHFIRQNRNRLLYYIEETNEGKGFIKELCYSADGRLVCSPFGRGMRLLALNEDCSELSQTARSLRAPRPLADVGQSLGVHQDLVVSSRFNPRYHMLVTGCLEGKIVWYEPYSGEALY
ncbi:unnamed protein product [Diatraea saccharalis]|uniref:Uncharacterized protein n=1 Tax=Diatraea saccharalis TaxID=40085 RepID=A0A9P0G2U7_9NEOP|nr:unnamed protein product [Diatraea saccharalis]